MVTMAVAKTLGSGVTK